MPRHDKFRKYWESLGCPTLEVKNNRNEWVVCTLPPLWNELCDYRIVDDPNWEVRLQWVNSGRTLPIEFYNKICWCPANVPQWKTHVKYRIKPEGNNMTTLITSEELIALTVDNVLYSKIIETLNSSLKVIAKNGNSCKLEFVYSNEMKQFVLHINDMVSNISIPKLQYNFIYYKILDDLKANNYNINVTKTNQIAFSWNII